MPVASVWTTAGFSSTLQVELVVAVIVVGPTGGPGRGGGRADGGGCRRGDGSCPGGASGAGECGSSRPIEGQVSNHLHPLDGSH